MKKVSISSTVAVVGGMSLRRLPPSVVDLANSYLRVHLSGVDPSPLLTVEQYVKTFYRVEVNGRLIFSAQYGRVKRRNSYTVLYKSSYNEKQYGLIQYFVLTENNGVLAVLQALQKTSVPLQSEFQLTSNVLNNVFSAATPVLPRPTVYDVVSVDAIVEKCIFIDTGGPSKYVVRFPNSITAD